MEDIIQVEKRIGAMQRQGGTVAYRRRIGNEEDYIEPSAAANKVKFFILSFYLFKNIEFLRIEIFKELYVLTMEGETF